MGKYYPQIALFQIGPANFKRFRAGKAGMEQTRRLIDIMARLRGPEGCPWDREQNPATLRAYVIEEAHELAEAIDTGSWDGIREELGDLLLQVAFLAQIAAEEGRFGFEDVAGGIADKLVRRHPHVFGEGEARDIPDIWRRWDAIKMEEKRERGQPALENSRLEGIPRSLPSLGRARLLADKAARAGFDWPAPEGIIEKISEETREVASALSQGNATHLTEEIGDLLFATASLARRLHIDPEGALSRANQKFENRFRTVESLAAQRSLVLENLEPDALDALWEEAKQSGR